jgi:hypothetical protein
MALELFNTTTKSEVKNTWYPKESETFLKQIMIEIQEGQGVSKFKQILRKDQIREIIKYFGKPDHIKDETYNEWKEYLKKEGQW